MEYAGAPLTCDVPLSPGNVAAAVAWVCDACEALVFRGLFYTDIKPDNVLSGAGGLFLCDYGGMTHISEGNVASATYPPARHPRGMGIPPTEASVAHGLGALVATLCFKESLRALSFRSTEDVPFDCDAVDSLMDAQNDVLQKVSEYDARLGRILEAAWAPHATLNGVRQAIQSA